MGVSSLTSKCTWVGASECVCIHVQREEHIRLKEKKEIIDAEFSRNEA